MIDPTLPVWAGEVDVLEHSSDAHAGDQPALENITCIVCRRTIAEWDVEPGFEEIDRQSHVEVCLFRTWSDTHIPAPALTVSADAGSPGSIRVSVVDGRRGSRVRFERLRGGARRRSRRKS